MTNYRNTYRLSQWLLFAAVVGTLAVTAAWVMRLMPHSVAFTTVVSNGSFESIETVHGDEIRGGSDSFSLENSISETGQLNFKGTDKFDELAVFDPVSELFELNLKNADQLLSWYEDVRKHLDYNRQAFAGTAVETAQKFSIDAESGQQAYQLFQLLAEQDLASALTLQSKIRSVDIYLATAIEHSVNPSNVHQLAPYLLGRNYGLADVAVRHGLHIQEYDLFLSVYDHLERRSQLGESNSSVVAGIAETSYWEIQESLIENAVSDQFPLAFLDALYQHGYPNHHLLVSQMWQTHLADEYKSTFWQSNKSGKLNRVGAAIKYGVRDALDLNQQLLESGMFAEKNFEDYIEGYTQEWKYVDFIDRLEYDSGRLIWVIN